MIVKYYPNEGSIKVVFSIDINSGWSYTYLRDASISFTNDWKSNDPSNKEHLLGTVNEVKGELHGFNIIVLNDSDTAIEVPTSVSYFQEVNGEWSELIKKYTVDDDTIPPNGVMGSNSGLGANVNFLPIS